MAAASGLLLALVVLRRTPPRWSCPRCHHATSPVRDFWLRPVRALFERRWCARCHWSGIARRRKWIDARPAPKRPAQEFAWARPDAETARSADDLHGGFRWASPGEDPARPVDFRWRRREPPADSGFQWRA
jgi:hypothetical protein